MCAISYYLERDNIMTTGISLVRENAASMAPPRSLWVPFPLGRPLGIANDPDFQHRVIAAALALFNSAQGPVLEDFPEDAPTQHTESALACPVTFVKPVTTATSWEDRLSDELNMLKPWYNLGKRRRNGRTLAGVSNSSIDEIIQRLATYLDTATLPITDLTWFKHATEDAKTYYLEAITAQPDGQDPDNLQTIFWTQTLLADALVILSEQLSSAPGLEQVARILVPRKALDRRANFSAAE